MVAFCRGCVPETQRKQLSPGTDAKGNYIYFTQEKLRSLYGVWRPKPDYQSKSGPVQNILPKLKQQKGTGRNELTGNTQR